MSKVVHIVLDQELLEAVDELRAKLNVSRSELVREACRLFVASAEGKAYTQGYLRTPETTEIGEAQAAVLKKVLELGGKVNAARDD